MSIEHVITGMQASLDEERNKNKLLIHQLDNTTAALVLTQSKLDNAMADLVDSRKLAEDYKDSCLGEVRKNQRLAIKLTEAVNLNHKHEIESRQFCRSIKLLRVISVVSVTIALVAVIAAAVVQ